MATVLQVPTDLMPTALVYQDDLPAIIGAVIQECSVHWQHGDVDKAIRCAEQAQALATKADYHPVIMSVASVWLADLYREANQMGPALAYCQRALDNIRLQPNYKHRHHAEAVIHYLQGLLHHALGANTKAMADYQQALTSFEKAIEHWNSSITWNATRAGKCEKAIKWISALYGCLTGGLSPVSGGSEMQIPAANGQDYELARLELAAYLRPSGVIINGQSYRLHRPDSGTAFSSSLAVRWNAHHFAVRVPKDQWAGEHSAQGDYILAKRERKADNPTGAGVLWDDGQQQWKYGTLTYNENTGRLWFRPFHLIGGAPQDAEVEDQDIGIVRALLKPT